MCVHVDGPGLLSCASAGSCVGWESTALDLQPAWWSVARVPPGFTAVFSLSFLCIEPICIPHSPSHFSWEGLSVITTHWSLSYGHVLART